MTRALTILIAALLIAGCGGGDDPDQLAPPETVQQDSAAQAVARNAVTEIEACYVDAQNYAKCDVPAPAQVVEAGRGSYTIVTPSESGTDFVFEKLDDGTTERTCSAPGDGGCSPEGDW